MKHLKSIAVGIGMLALLGQPALAQEIIYSTHTGPNYDDNIYPIPRFFERITAATNGARTAKIVTGGVLASGPAALSSVKAGAFESTILVYAYTTSDLPVHSLIGDFYSRDPRVAAAATTETLLQDCPQCMEEMKKQNIVSLNNVSSTPYHLLCTEGNRIQSLADAKGKKVRAVGSYGQLAAHLGMVPVNLAIQEVREALERGQIDCAMNDPSQIEALQLDMVKYVTEVPLGTFQSMSAIVVNRDFWNGLSDEERQIWIDSSAQLIPDYEFNFMRRIDGVMERAKSGAGVEVVQPDQDLLDAVAAFSATQQSVAVETASGRGVQNAQAIADAYAANTEKWTQIVNEIGEGDWSEEQWNQFGARVKEEIYSNVSFE